MMFNRLVCIGYTLVPILCLQYPRKAKLLAELEISSTTEHNYSDNHDLEEDLEVQLDEEMQMIAVRQKMFLMLRVTSKMPKLGITRTMTKKEHL